MEQFLNNLQRQASENPVLALGVAAGLITSITKLMDSVSWRKEVVRRTKKDRLK